MAWVIADIKETSSFLLAGYSCQYLGTDIGVSIMIVALPNFSETFTTFLLWSLRVGWYIS